LNSQGRKKIFYGYVVVGAAFSIMSISWGAQRTFGVFLDPLLNDFGCTRAQLSGAFTLGMIVMGVLNILAGRWTDQIGPRPVLIACSLFLGAGYMLVSQARSIGEFYFYYGLIIGIGMSGTWVPLMSTVSRWFITKRSLMSGMLATGPPVAIMVMPFVASFLITQYGWRVSYVILGVGLLVVVFSAALFLRRDPAVMGTVPYGFEQESQGGIDVQNRGVSFREALPTRQFWILCFLSFCDAFLINVIVVHIIPHARDLGGAPTASAGVLSLAAGVSIFGRIFMGWVADRFSNRWALLICLMISVVAFVILLFARGLWMLYLFSVFYGIGLWATGSIMPPLVADYFGLKSHGSIYSCTALAGTIGGGVGPILIGFTFDLAKNYRPGFLLCFGISLMALIAILFLKPLHRFEGERSRN
jgi:MFS family permease